jgi:hypothetical protein
MSDDTRRYETVDYDASYPPELYAPGPVLTLLSPATSPVGVPVTVTITGTGFVASSVARADGSPLPTVYVSATSLTVSGTPLTDGAANVTVANGTRISNALVFTVTNVAGETQTGPGRRRRARWSASMDQPEPTPAEDEPAPADDTPAEDAEDDQP